MAITSNTASTRRYRVEGQLPENFHDEIRDRIQKSAFREIEASNLKEVSIGWVTVNNPFGNENIDDSFDKDGYIALSMRIDKKSIPSQTLKSYIVKEEQKHLEASKKERLSYNERKSIKEAVIVKLLQQALPISAVYDFFWNINTGDLFFFGTSDDLNNKFIDLFEETFQIRLIKMSPYSIAASKNISEEQILSLEPASFSLQEGQED